MSPITTHILDTAAGKPAAGVPVQLQRLTGSSWTDLAQGSTNADGRVTDLLKPGTLVAATYRITFDTGAYYREQGAGSFYPEVAVVFQVENTQEHYHVPLLLSPFGYSTYRGS